MEPNKDRKVVAEFHIVGYDDDSVEITGPVGEFIGFRHIMNRAERGVLKKIAESGTGQIDSFLGFRDTMNRAERNVLDAMANAILEKQRVVRPSGPEIAAVGKVH